MLKELSNCAFEPKLDIIIICLFRVAQMSTMKGENYLLQHSLDDAQFHTRPDDTEERRQKDREERQRMRNAVAQQQDQIQVLKVNTTVNKHSQ